MGIRKKERKKRKKYRFLKKKKHTGRNSIVINLSNECSHL